MKKLIIASLIATAMFGCSSDDNDAPIVNVDPVINPENIIGTSEIQINRDGTVSYRVIEPVSNIDSRELTKGNPVGAYIPADELKSVQLKHLHKPIIEIANEDGSEKNYDWNVHIIMKSGAQLVVNAIGSYEFSEMGVTTVYGDWEDVILHHGNEIMMSDYALNTGEVGVAYIGNYFYISNPEGDLVGTVETIREFTPYIPHDVILPPLPGEGSPITDPSPIPCDENEFCNPVTDPEDEHEITLPPNEGTPITDPSPIPCDENEFCNPVTDPEDEHEISLPPNEGTPITDPSPIEPCDELVFCKPIQDPDEEAGLLPPVTIPVHDIRLVHDAEKVEVNTDGSLLISVKEDQRFTLYTSVNSLEKNVTLAYYAEPIVDIKAINQPDVWFINVYLEKEGKKTTLTYNADGSVKHNGVSYASWNEALSVLSDYVVRTDYRETTGISSLRLGNFMFRSSSTNQVVEDSYTISQYNVADEYQKPKHYGYALNKVEFIGDIIEVTTGDKVDFRSKYPALAFNVEKPVTPSVSDGWINVYTTVNTLAINIDGRVQDNETKLVYDSVEDYLEQEEAELRPTYPWAASPFKTSYVWRLATEASEPLFNSKATLTIEQ